VPDTIDRILKLQKELQPNVQGEVPDHNPEILLVGCIDARLDITKDLGIQRGKALIVRNIAALVAGINEEGKSRSTEAAAIEFAVAGKRVKHIVVMGHTHCGGIEACINGLDLPDVQRYLEPLQPTRRDVLEHGGGIEEQARRMEEAAVKLSISNLMTYPAVAEAVNAGKLQLHGWVIDIVTARLKVLGKDGNFSEL
jgi:carbonic anhydrase